MLDINDNKPIFEMDSYYTSIPENTPPSFIVSTCMNERKREREREREREIKIVNFFF